MQVVVSWGGGARRLGEKGGRWLGGAGVQREAAPVIYREEKAVERSGFEHEKLVRPAAMAVGEISRR
jgi:hypothetical protein